MVRQLVLQATCGFVEVEPRKGVVEEGVTLAQHLADQVGMLSGDAQCLGIPTVQEPDQGSRTDSHSACG